MNTSKNLKSKNLKNIKNKDQESESEDIQLNIDNKRKYSDDSESSEISEENEIQENNKVKTLDLNEGQYQDIFENDSTFKTIGVIFYKANLKSKKIIRNKINLNYSNKN